MFSSINIIKINIMFIKIFETIQLLNKTVEIVDLEL